MRALFKWIVALIRRITRRWRPMPWISGQPRVAGRLIWASEKRNLPPAPPVAPGPYEYEADLVELLQPAPGDSTTPVVRVSLGLDIEKLRALDGLPITVIGPVLEVSA